MTQRNNVAYRADGLIKGIAYGNGLTEARAYDLRGQLTNQALGSEMRDYSYDLNGNLTQAVRTSGTSLYAYDVLDRLTQETSATVGNLGYSYDPNGNRLSLLDNGETKSYSYSPSTNRLTQIGHKEVVLDAAGNTVSKDNGKWRYEYTASGRLFKVYKEGKWVATYLYNAQGQRTQKTTKHGTTVYHYDQQGHLIAETAKTGELQRAYVWLNDMPLAQIDRHGKGEEKSRKAKPAKETIAYLHTDHLGTPRIATDANQQIVWRWESDAFGAKKPEDLDDEHDDDHDITVNLRFPGQYFDKETKLYYNWNRYYDPKIGRYITSDPIGLAGGLNTFTYVGNNPLRFIDPEGLEGEAPNSPNPNFPDPTVPEPGLESPCVECIIIPAARAGKIAKACIEIAKKEVIQKACKNSILAAALGTAICTQGAEGKPPGSARSYPQRREEIENVRQATTTVPRRNTGGISDK